MSSSKRRVASSKSAQEREIRKKGQNDGFFSEEQQELRLKAFEDRRLQPHRYLDLDWLTSIGFEFPTLLSAQGLDTFCQIKGNQYPRLVKQFYANMIKRGDDWITMVCGKIIMVNRSLIIEVGGLKDEGITFADCDENEQFADFNYIRTYIECLRENYGFEDGKPLKAGHLRVNERLLHYIIVYILVPRMYNNAQPSAVDLKIIYAMKRGIQLDWPYIIANYMIVCRKDSALPYPVLVSRIIEMSGIDVSEEAKLAHRDRAEKLDFMTLNKMHIECRNGIWCWKSDPQAPPQAGQQDEEMDELLMDNMNTELPTDPPTEPSYSHEQPPYIDNLIGQMRGLFQAQSDHFQGQLDNHFNRVQATQEDQWRRFQEEQSSNMQCMNTQFEDMRNRLYDLEKRFPPQE